MGGAVMITRPHRKLSLTLGKPEAVPLIFDLSTGAKRESLLIRTCDQIHPDMKTPNAFLTVIALLSFASANLSPGFAADVVERCSSDTNCTLTISENGLAEVRVPASPGTNVIADGFTFKPGQESEICALLKNFGMYAFLLERKNVRPFHRVFGSTKNNETSLIFSIAVPNNGPSVLLIEQQFHLPGTRPDIALSCVLDEAQTMKVWRLLFLSKALAEHQKAKRR